MVDSRTPIAFTPGVDVYWTGELDDAFRDEVSRIYEQSLSDQAWESLRRCVRSYAMQLNHEVQAGSLGEQKATAFKLSGAISALLAIIEEADADAMGQIVSRRLADKWEEEFHPRREFDDNLEKMVGGMVAAFGQTRSAGEEQAWRLIGDWLSAGWMASPSEPDDFIADLRRFEFVARLFASGLERGTEYSERGGAAWTEHVARLTEWAMTNQLDATVSNSGARRHGHGKFVELMKAINNRIPETITPELGKPARRMREPGISDASLANKITRARNGVRNGLQGSQASGNRPPSDP